jgi:N-acetylmuramoyl-L-alanine amidase
MLSALNLPLVVIDAGHGGRDPGAEGVGGVREKDVVLEVARRLATVLTTRFPVSVMMTRTDDSFVPIDGRLAMTGDDAVLFLSLHANACSDPSPRGFEVFYGGGRLRTASTRSQDPRAALLGRCLHQALGAFGIVRHHPQPGSWAVLARNQVPSALVEIGYLTHPEEAVRTQDAAYQERLAGALADGVGAFLRASAPPL